jgi:hypothetical protein
VALGHGPSRHLASAGQSALGACLPMLQKFRPSRSTHSPLARQRRIKAGAWAQQALHLDQPPSVSTTVVQHGMMPRTVRPATS